MASPKKSFLLRVDPALWNELEAWAADELRSVNGQIEYILRDAVQKRRGKKGSRRRLRLHQALEKRRDRRQGTRDEESVPQVACHQ